MAGPIRILLVGGTSHVGKTTLAMDLARRLGWQHLSTDQLARHPGRPWRNDGSKLPADVIDYYRSAAAPDLLDSVVRHYQQNVWPITDAIVRSRAANPYDPPLILEGSALLPGPVGQAQLPATRAVWLTAPEAVIVERIQTASNLSSRSEQDRRLIEAFLERALQFDQRVRAGAETAGLPCLDSTDSRTSATIADLTSGS